MNKKVFHTKEEKHRGYCDCGDCGKITIVQPVKAGCGHTAHMCTKCFNAGKVIKTCFELCGGEEHKEEDNDDYDNEEYEDDYNDDDVYEDDDEDDLCDDDDDDDYEDAYAIDRAARKLPISPLLRMSGKRK